MMTDPSEILMQMENINGTDALEGLFLNGTDNSMADKLRIPVDKYRCGHYTLVGLELHNTIELTETCRFWSEGILSSAVAVFGLLGNIICIWVLSVPEMRCTSFNRLLLALAVIDCLFILPGIIIFTSKVFSWSPEWYNHLFPVFLYPFSEIALCSSMYMTVAIAVERYIGLCRPLQRLAGRPCSARFYILPVLTIGLLLNVPKFLESETHVVSMDPVTNATTTRIRVTSLRMHPAYITYYWLWTRLLATGVIPLTILAILNTKIYLAIRRSKAQLRSLAIRSALPMAILGKNVNDLCIDSPKSGLIKNGNGVEVVSATPGSSPLATPPPAPLSMTAAAKQQIRRTASSIEPTIRRTFSRQKDQIIRSHSTAVATTTTTTAMSTSGGGTGELNLAPTLFGVVIVFVICNSLRLVLNFYDFSVVDEIISCENKGVGRLPPPWIFCSISISHLLLMVNSSVNFLVYCFAGTRFRTVLTRKVHSLWKRCATACFSGPSALGGSSKPVSPPNEIQERTVLRDALIRGAAADRRQNFESRC